MGIFENHTFTYGSEGWGDVLTGINGTAVTSDTIGNILSDGTSTYTWKNGRQLATSTKNGQLGRILMMQVVCGRSAVTAVLPIPTPTMAVN